MFPTLSRCLCKLYLKQQLTAIAFGPVPPPAEPVDADDTQQPAMEHANWVDTDIKEHEETRECLGCAGTRHIARTACITTVF